MCSLHFAQHDIIREESASNTIIGRKVKIPLRTPRPREGAVPSILPTEDNNNETSDLVKQGKEQGQLLSIL